MIKKRIIQIGITLACIFSLVTVPVYASSSKYTVPGLDLTISIPAEYDVFTLDMSSNDPLFLDYGTTKSNVDAQFTASTLRMLAIISKRYPRV